MQIMNKIDSSLLEQYGFVPISVKDDYLFVVINSNSNKEEVNLKLKEYYPQQVKFIQVPEQDLTDLIRAIESEIKNGSKDDKSAKQAKLGEMLVQKGIQALLSGRTSLNS